MVAAIAPEPVFAGTSLTDTRHRPSAAVRGSMPDSAPPTPRSDTSGNDPQPQQERRSGASHFAAAVISGALSPRPRSMHELIRRIGVSEIPVESEARLKDIIV